MPRMRFFSPKVAQYFAAKPRVFVMSLLRCNYRFDSDLSFIALWSLFAVTQMETACVELILHRKIFDAKISNPDIIQAAEKKLLKPLEVLNNHLAGKNFLVASTFTVADINMTGILSYALGGEFDFSPYHEVARYLDAILSRPACKKAGIIPRN